MLFTTLVLQDWSQGYILSYFLKLLRVLSLSRMLDEFSLTCKFHHVWENFLFIVFVFLKKGLNLRIFTHALVPHSKLQAEFFENLFPPRRKGWRRPWFALSKLNQKIWRWHGTLVYLCFLWFILFLNVMALQFCK